MRRSRNDVERIGILERPVRVLEREIALLIADVRDNLVSELLDGDAGVALVFGDRGARRARIAQGEPVPLPLEPAPAQSRLPGWNFSCAPLIRERLHILDAKAPTLSALPTHRAPWRHDVAD